MALRFGEHYLKYTEVQHTMQPWGLCPQTPGV